MGGVTKQSFTVGPEGRGTRLDAFLGHAAGLSRSRLKKAVQEGHCRVDGALCLEADLRLAPGRVVELDIPDADSALQPEAGELAVLYRDAALVVLDKPAGLTVHPCPSCPEGTLVHRLLAHFPELGRLEGFRPGIVHRLDKDTSGLLVAALTEPARLALTGSFAVRAVRKTYLALTRGVPGAEGRVDLPVGRHPTLKTKMAVVPENRGGKPALTEWRTLYADPAGRFALLAVTIHTGRTHQIRVHLAHIGHPLWGDRVYAPHDPAWADPAPRQMLHAWKLAFPHPDDGRTMAFLCPPPADFPATIEALARRTRNVVLTGTPGCGKSTALRLLGEAGVPVWSADAAVARLYKPGADGWLLLRGRYGERFLQPSGQAGRPGEEPVDRAALTRALMEDPGLRRELEALIHPLVFADMEQFFAEAGLAGAPLAVAEVPLWHESRKPVGDALVVTVACPVPARHARLARKRGWSAEKAAAVDAWQWTEDAKIRASHYVVDNSGTEAELAGRVRVLLERLLERREAERVALREQLSGIWGETAGPLPGPVA